GRSARELRDVLAVDERQLQKLFARLNGLGLVELRPNLKARVRKAAALRWRPDGPIRRLYASQVRDELMKSKLAAPMEALRFRSAELSEASCQVLLRKVVRLSTGFRELAELDRSLPSREKRSFAMMLAARPWVFSMFQGISSRAAVDPSAIRRKTG